MSYSANPRLIAQCWAQTTRYYLIYSHTASKGSVEKTLSHLPVPLVSNTPLGTKRTGDLPSPRAARYLAGAMPPASPWFRSPPRVSKQETRDVRTSRMNASLSRV